MKYLEFGLLCIKTVVGSFMIAVAIWSIPYVLFDVHQTQERDRVMSEAWHRINNEDAHLGYIVLMNERDWSDTLVSSIHIPEGATVCRDYLPTHPCFIYHRRTQEHK